MTNKTNEITKSIFSKSINMENFKDALLASLYSQIEFLRNQIDEKDLLIRTLIINEKDVDDFDPSRLI